ncbi:MAG: hypothetical protein OXS29_00680 [bacterium]|nr:hypothetical protein [bacterium]MDE0290578.1 hypothetical protein [bacterium]MDE0437439.1 hypothetical protein [bacterium]
MEPLDPIVETLAAHAVSFVVIGNYGAQLHGAEVHTADADVAYQRSEENHRRLAAALGEIDARIIRSETFTIPLPTDQPGIFEERDFWRLRTAHGDVDLIFEPLGGGYDHLLPNAVRVMVGRYPVLVASIDDIIRSKELADRAKDHQSLPALRRFRDQQQRSQADSSGLGFDL